MGRVRPVFIKKISHELMKKYSDLFSNDFENNKKLLDEFVIIQSRVVRNRIAGYITHLKNVEIEQEEQESFEIE
ncbi:MAG: 30S ribosomal protein S17e [Candidatus Lokiarchaeota archaeon]|nr:30S ribosomal protein S17e [Candidatus Lokiarchaeota archaeon]